jgi:hypothetical protein
MSAASRAISEHQHHHDRPLDHGRLPGWRVLSRWMVEHVLAASTVYSVVSHWPRGSRRAGGVGLVLAFVACVASPALAAGGPGWELSARTYPTNLVAPIDQEDEVLVSAEGGTFALSFEGDETAGIAFDAGTGAVQSALEGLASVGAGNVAVSGSPGDYAVRFTGLLGGRQLAELGVNGAELTSTTEPPSTTERLKRNGAASGMIDVDVFNVGSSESNGTITVTDTLPAGLLAKEAGELVKPSEGAGENFGVDPVIGHSLWDCTGNGPGGRVPGATVVTCTNDPAGLPHFDGGGGSPTTGYGYERSGGNPQPTIAITVEAEGDASRSVNRVAIAGGGASASASTEDPVTVSSSPASFGLAGWDGWFSNPNGTIDTQAGSHPYTATFSYDFATALVKGPGSAREGVLPGGEPRDMESRLPPGLVVNPLATPQCTRAQLDDETCPQASQVGVVEAFSVSGVDVVLRVFNMVSPAGVAGEIGFNFEGILVFLEGGVETGGSYGITTHIDNIPQRVTMQAVLTLWGVPAESSHDLWRAGRAGGCAGGCNNESSPFLKPFLTLPTTCGAPQSFSINVLSGWQNPGANSEAVFKSHDADDEPVGLTGCEDLAFGPSLSIVPEVSETDKPTGLVAEARPDLGGLEEPELLGSSDIKHVTVTLPEGFVVNPGQAAGLQACQETVEQSAIGSENAPNCPPASKVGTVKIKSPLIEADPEKELEGDVYLLQSNPPHLHLLVAASADGVNLKLVGIVHLSETTGQLTTTFGEDPEAEHEDPFLAGHLALPPLPASDFKLSFEGGARAALDTPTECGTYEASGAFTPWAAPFLPEFSIGAAFAIAGSGGSSCSPSPLPFAPTMEAGTTSVLAGGYSELSVQLARGDGQQRIGSARITMPPGVAGMISKVPLCPEPQANAGDCPASSQIGHAIAEAGPGQSPLVIPQPGEPESRVYLTGPYEGAPFGLSIVTPVIAGPFNLGLNVVRGKIEVDRHTAQITATTDASGPHAIPTILDGVPTDLRTIEVIIDQPEFIFNPTNCNPMSFSGIATSTEGTTAALSSRLQVGSCKDLKFQPSVKVSTSGKASKANGASLTFKIAYPRGAVGTQSWFKEAKFVIPKQLPARLTTIQKACLAATFEANPASCPPGSVIGHAIVHTPVLPVPLEGPVYFVSYGSAKFPDAIIVLQGDNVTVDLTGETFIKNGVTSATFPNTPDVPFETLEATLPTGPHSEFGTNIPAKDNYDLCGHKLTVPTFLQAQNGLEIHQSTNIAITGCAKAKKGKKHKHAKAKSR